jgi:hypothetical protein
MFVAAGICFKHPPCGGMYFKLRANSLSKRGKPAENHSPHYPPFFANFSTTVKEGRQSLVALTT